MVLRRIGRIPVVSVFNQNRYSNDDDKILCGNEETICSTFIAMITMTERKGCVIRLVPVILSLRVSWDMWVFATCC